MDKSIKRNKNALSVHLESTGAGFEQWILLRSDVHWDNVHCDREMEKKHLDQAKERNAFIIDMGDLFCAMQGNWDLRKNKSALRNEHKVDNYLDALIETAIEYYAPYAENFLCFGRGNHETAIQKRHETDLTQRLVDGLRLMHGSNVHAMGYTGWIRFSFRLKTERCSRTMWFTHGSGGGGPVTEDIISSARQRTIFDGCDIMASGHVHRSWAQEYVKLSLDQACKVQRRIGWYIKVPGYKDAYGDGSGGFEVERGHGPRPKGSYWIRFHQPTNRVGSMEIEVVKAV